MTLNMIAAHCYCSRKNSTLREIIIWCIPGRIMKTHNSKTYWNNCPIQRSVVLYTIYKMKDHVMKNQWTNYRIIFLNFNCSHRSILSIFQCNKSSSLSGDRIFCLHISKDNLSLRILAPFLLSALLAVCSETQNWNLYDVIRWQCVFSRDHECSSFFHKKSFNLTLPPYFCNVPEN